MGLEFKFFGVSSKRNKNILYSYGDMNFFYPFLEAKDEEIRNLDYNFLLWRKEENNLINALYSDKLLNYCFSASSDSLEDLLGSFGVLIKEFSFKMDDDNFKYSDTARSAYFDPWITKIILNKKIDVTFYLVGLLALQANFLPSIVYLQYPIKRRDGQEYKVPIIIDYGKFHTSGITDKTVLTIAGPDFQKDIEFIYFNPEKERITVREVLTFINNCKNTGRRRKEEEFPSYWPKAAIFIAKDFPLEDLKKHFEEDKVRNDTLYHFITPIAGPKILPGVVVPSSQKCNIKFFEFRKNEGLFEKILK